MAVDVTRPDAFVQLASEEERLRLEAIANRWKAFHGDTKKPLRVRAGGPDDNVRLPLAGPIVRKGVSFLFGQPPAFSVQSLAAAQAEGEQREADAAQLEAQVEAAQQHLDAVWKANRKASLLKKLALNGAVAGHVFVKIVPDQPGLEVPRLVALDPSTCAVTWNDEDVEDAWRYTISWNAVSREPGLLSRLRSRMRRQLIERNDAGTAWLVVNQESTSSSGGWRTIGSPLLWPHPFGPIVDWQHLPVPNVYYGLSDLEDDLLELLQAASFTASNVARILRLYAHPRTWAKGLTAGQVAQLDISPDRVVALPNPDAELHNLEMTSDLTSSLAFYQELRQLIHERSARPEVASGKLENAGSLSGVALAILYGPLLEDTEDKQTTYGEGLDDLNRRLLELAGFEDLDVMTEWPDVLPADPVAEGQALMQDQALGVSKETLLAKRGYDPEEEKERREEEASDALESAQAAFDRGAGEQGQGPELDDEEGAQA